MSYDVALFFRHPVFPFDQWKQVMADFNSQEREVRRSKHNHNVVAEWTVSSNESMLWIELRDVRRYYLHKPVSAQWQIYIARSSHRARDVWLQFALPYHALVLMEDVNFYDLQHDVQIENVNEYLKFVSQQLGRFGLTKMFDLGLLDAEGNAIF